MLLLFSVVCFKTVSFRKVFYTLFVVVLYSCSNISENLFVQFRNFIYHNDSYNRIFDVSEVFNWCLRHKLLRLISLVLCMGSTHSW